MRIAVVGGGLAGCAAAVALRNQGSEVEVFEAADQPRREGQSVSLLMNGTAAFAALGMRPQPGHRITQVTFLRRGSGRPLMTVDAAALEAHFGHPYVVVPRRELLEPLLMSLEGSITYSKAATAVRNTVSGAEISFGDGSTEEADLVVVADGARSVLRAGMWPEDAGQFFSVAFQGTAPLPSGYGSPDTVFMSVGSGALAGTFPTTEGQVGWFIDQRARSPRRPPGRIKDYLVSRFQDWPGALPSLIGSTPEEEVEKEVYPIYVRRPRWGEGRIVLVGDAAHAFNPALGQGTSQGFTDAIALAAAVAGAGDAGDVLGPYATSRSRRVMRLWRMAKMTLGPGVGAISEMARWNSDRMATRSWRVLTRPDPVVSSALASNG